MTRPHTETHRVLLPDELDDRVHFARVRRLEAEAAFEATASDGVLRRRRTDRNELIPITDEDAVRSRLSSPFMEDEEVGNVGAEASPPPAFRARARVFADRLLDVIFGRVRS